MAERVLITHPEALGRAVNILRSSGVIAVPTDTLYGLTCDATNFKAIEQMFWVKARSPRKPFAICLPHIKDIPLYANTQHLPSGLLDKLLPGPVTLVLNSCCRSQVDKLCQKNGKIGIRVPRHHFMQELAATLGKPLALTSANLSGSQGVVCCDELDKELWERVPAVFDGGEQKIDCIPEDYREGSTIIDLSDKGSFCVIRKGLIEAYGRTLRVLKKFGYIEQMVEEPSSEVIVEQR